MFAQLNTTPIASLRNSRTAVKRAKSEYKQSVNSKTHSIEHTGMVHELLGHKSPKMNCKLKVC